MGRTRGADDPEHWTHYQINADALPLFDGSASVEAGMTALTDTAAKNAEAIARLVPLARELAARSPNGITVSNLRLAAVQRGLLTGQEKGRALSYLGAVMRWAGLEPTGTYQRSAVVRSHGNLGMTWRLPDGSVTGGGADR